MKRLPWWLRDFVFARDTTPETGMDIAVEFLETNTSYNVTLWSFDTGSTGARVSDWTANGTLVRSAYTFDGNVLPAGDACVSHARSGQRINVLFPRSPRVRQ